MTSRLSTLTLAVLPLSIAFAAEDAAAPTPPPPPPPLPADTFASYGYAWTEFGGSFPDGFDAESIVFGTAPLTDSISLELKPGFAVQGGFGDQLTPWFGMEFQAGFLFNSFEDVRNVGNIQS